MVNTFSRSLSLVTRDLLIKGPNDPHSLHSQRTAESFLVSQFQNLGTALTWPFRTNQLCIGYDSQGSLPILLWKSMWFWWNFYHSSNTFYPSPPWQSDNGIWKFLSLQAQKSYLRQRRGSTFPVLSKFRKLSLSAYGPESLFLWEDHVKVYWLPSYSLMGNTSLDTPCLLSVLVSLEKNNPLPA